MRNQLINDKKMLIYGLLIILTATFFTGWFYYVNEPLNEDIGQYFDSTSPETRITTVGQVIDNVKYIYLTRSGRIPGYFLIKVSKLFSRTVQAVVCALIFSVNIILTIRIIVKDAVKAISSPVLFIALFMALYWFRPYIGVSFRWEFVAIYSFTVTAVLLYYNLTGSRFETAAGENKKNSRKSVLIYCLIQLLGVVAGMSHEILSFGLIALIGTEWITDLIRHKTKPGSILRHWGLALGYLTGFFAPGNLQRLNADKTVNAYSDTIASAEQAGGGVGAEGMSGFAAAMSGYAGRIGASFDMHEITVMGVGGHRQAYILFIVVFALALLAMIYMLLHGQKKTVLNMIIDDAGLVVSSISSVLMWAFVYWQPVYVVWLPTIFVYIALFEFVIKIPEMLAGPLKSNTGFRHVCNIAHIAVPVIAIIAFICIYGSELASFAHTSLMRRERIAYAQENGLTEITVPRYDGNLSAMRYSLYALNNQKEYDLGYYTKYYGVHLIIED